MTDTRNDAEFVELNVTPAEEGVEVVNPAEEAPETPKEGETKGEEPKEPEGEEKGQEKPAEDEPLRDTKGRFKGGAEGRIAELTRLRRDAERSADYWKGIATHNGAQSGTAATAKPTPDQYEDYGDYVEALTDWKVAETQRKTADTNATEAAKTVEQHRGAEWSAKIGAVKATIPDFDAVMDKADTPTAPHVAEALMDADRGPELLYHLAQNPEIVERLNEMSPNRAAIELGRIEATLEAPAEKPKPRETTKSNAPAPITPVSGGSATTKDPSKMNMEEYSAWRKTQKIIG